MTITRRVNNCIIIHGHIVAIRRHIDHAIAAEKLADIRGLLLPILHAHFDTLPRLVYCINIWALHVRVHLQHVFLYLISVGVNGVLRRTYRQIVLLLGLLVLLVEIDLLLDYLQILLLLPGIILRELHLRRLLALQINLHVLKIDMLCRLKLAVWDAILARDVWAHETDLWWERLSLALVLMRWLKEPKTREWAYRLLEFVESRSWLLVLLFLMVLLDPMVKVCLQCASRFLMIWSLIYVMICVDVRCLLIRIFGWFFEFHLFDLNGIVVDAVVYRLPSQANVFRSLSYDVFFSEALGWLLENILIRLRRML